MAKRIDLLLIERGIFESRAKARAAIEAGNVKADGKTVAKPSQKFDADVEILAKAAHPYVSRAGLKLAHGLSVFEIDIEGRHCLDIGASTGGFTQVLLEAGATHVDAVDVGREQLHASLVSDKRVTNLENHDARTLNRGILTGVPDIVVCDASFIALEKLLERPLSLAALDAVFIGLFKPQFQVGRKNIGRGGIVTDDEAIKTAWLNFSAWLNGIGWQIQKKADSPILGGDGNREYLFLATRQATGVS